MERVDIGVRNAALSPRSLRRRHFGSSTSMTSTSSSGSTVSTVSTDHLLNNYHHQQHQTYVVQQHGQLHSDLVETQEHFNNIRLTNQLTPMGLEQTTGCNTNRSTPSSPHQTITSIDSQQTIQVHNNMGRDVSPPTASCRSPPVFEYHFEFVTPTATSDSD